MATTPLTGSRYPVSSDSANVAQYFANLAFDLDDNTIPDFATTTARDNAYSAWVTAGGAMRNGLRCIVNALPYRRIGGSWRQEGTRIITRSTAPNSAIASGGGNETGVTAGLAALASFTLYEAATVAVSAVFRGGGAGAMECSLLINGVLVGDKGITRTDVTTTVVGAVALAAGTHTVAMHVDATGGAVTWVSGRLVMIVGIAE